MFKKVKFNPKSLIFSPFFFYRGLVETDLARRAASTFAPFSSAFRPVNKISDILQLSQAKHLDSGEICEVSTTAVDRDEDSASKFEKSQCTKITKKVSFKHYCD